MTAIEARHRKLNPSLFSLEDMVSESISFLREHEPPEGYFVGFSGGKDSIVTLELCRIAGVKHRAFYSATGIDPPEVVKFIRRQYSEVTFLKPPMSFWAGIKKWFPPFRMTRWCCNVLKKDASKNIPLGKRVMGIRSEESFKRASRPRIDEFKKRNQTLYKPIFDWKEWHIWDFIEKYSLAYPSLYDEGNHRIGCVICPFIVGPSPAAQKRIKIAKQRWPGLYNKFETTVTEWFVAKGKETKYGQIYKTPEKYLAAYYRGFELCPGSKT